MEDQWHYDADDDFEDDTLPFEDVLDQIDCIYKDGIAYMSVHTIDAMNGTIAQTVEDMHMQGVVEFSEETIKALSWVLNMWSSLHDTLDLKATVLNIPDDVSSITEED